MSQRPKNRITGALSAFAAYRKGLIDKAEFERQSRGETHFPVAASHGTRRRFDEFKKGDLGFHFGTEEQAKRRLENTRPYNLTAETDKDARIMDVRLNARNPLLVNRDVGAWEDPSTAASGLLGWNNDLRAKLSKQQLDDLQDIAQSTGAIYNPRWDIDDIYNAPEMKRMREILESHGYDSIRYPNAVENLYGATPGVSPRGLEIMRGLDEIKRKLDANRRADFVRDNPLSVTEMLDKDPKYQQWIEGSYKPSPSEAAVFKKYRMWEQGKRPMTPDERARYQDIDKRWQIVENRASNDPLSWIVLRPENVRLSKAEFDPEKLSSPNLMAGIGAGAVGLGAAANAASEREEREGYADGGAVYDNLVRRVAASFSDGGYAEGGDPDGINSEPMASGGTLELADGGAVYDNLVKRVAASLPAEGYAEGGGVDWNSYAQTYQQMMDPTYSGSTGLTYTQPLGAPQVTDNAIASGLSSFTPGSAGDGGARSGAAPNDTRSASAASLGVSPANLGMGLGTIASLATGIPGLGLVGSALGTLSEVGEINDALNLTGAQPLGFGQTLSAIGNNLSFGLAGTPASHSMVDNAIAGTVSSRGGASGPGTGDPEADAAAAAAAARGSSGNIAPGQGGYGTPGSDGYGASTQGDPTGGEGPAAL